MWKMPYPSEDGEALSILQPPVSANLFPALVCAPAPPRQAAWFALYTTARHEKRVARHLSERRIEHYLPLYRVRRKWSDGSRVTLDLPLFPGYLFVQAGRSERVRVLEVPGALAMVPGAGGQPAPLPEETIEALRKGIEQYGAEPHPALTAGQRVRIRCGAFAGMEGVVVREKGGCRVVLTLEHIMRSFSVELPASDLETIPAVQASPRNPAPLFGR